VPSLATSTISLSPGSKMGSESDFHAAMRGSLRSTTVTLMWGFCFAMMAHVGPPYTFCCRQKENDAR
jgi:hypothetical protein